MEFLSLIVGENSQARPASFYYTEYYGSSPNNVAQFILRYNLRSGDNATHGSTFGRASSTIELLLLAAAFTRTSIHRVRDRAYLRGIRS